MGKLADFLFGPDQRGPESSTNAPQVRASDPYVSDNGTVHDGSKALDLPTRADWSYNVSSGEALGMVAVYRAAQVISTSVIQLSFDAFRDDAELTPKPLVLRRPDPNESKSAFLEKTALSLVLNGNCFWRVFRDAQGRVTVLRVLNPHDVSIERDTEGNVTGYSHRGQKLAPNDVQHLSLMRVPGDARGRGPIQAAQAELRGAIDSRDYSANWFRDAGVPTGILANKSNGATAEQLEKAKERWIASQGGQRGPAVINGDWSWQSVYLSPEDAQWIAVRQFDTTAIARLFGIPAGLMLAAVEGTSQTYSNIAQSWTEFQRFTLARYVTEIEEAFSAVLPRGTEVHVNYEALLAPDVVTRYQMHLQALQAGWLTKDEVRAIEGLPALPNGLGEAQEPVIETPAPDQEQESADD